jgi:hypothetical protein
LQARGRAFGNRHLSTKLTMTISQSICRRNDDLIPPPKVPGPLRNDCPADPSLLELLAAYPAF